jgi:antitoxin component of MazEF toxin-antitoxin module
MKNSLEAAFTTTGELVVLIPKEYINTLGIEEGTDTRVTLSEHGSVVVDFLTEDLEFSLTDSEYEYLQNEADGEGLTLNDHILNELEGELVGNYSPFLIDRVVNL